MQNFIQNEKTVLTWKPKDFRQCATVRSIAETSTICEDSLQKLEIEHDYSKSFNDSDLLSRENWRGKAETLFLVNENIGKTEDVLNDITESNNENVERLVEEKYIDIPTFISCDTNDLSLSILLNSDNQIIENQSFSEKVIETEENNSKTFIHESTLLVNSIENEVIVEQQKDTQLERKYLEPKPSHSKFFSAYPEVKLNNKLVTKNVKRYLLKNGTSCGTSTIDDKICFLRNTCPFDSIAQIVFTSVLDDSAYYSIVENSDIAFFKFIFKFMNNGPSQQVYKERLMLLKPLYKDTKVITKTEHHEIIASYDAVDSPAEVWTKLLKSMPSSCQIEKCNKCGERKTEQLTLMPNHNTIMKKGFRALNKALQFHEIIYNKRCQCGGCSIVTTETNCHIFIELDIRENLRSTSKSYKLEELPPMLMLEKQYRLVGVVAGYPGHFVAYCRRLSGLWEQYNDLCTKVKSCTLKETIFPIAAIYIIHTDD